MGFKGTFYFTKAMNIKYILMKIIILSRGAGARHKRVTINPVGWGFDFHFRK